MKHKGVRLPAALLEPVSTCGSVLVCLPYQGLRALLALSERLEWKTTWIDETGQRQTLTDGQWALVDATIGGLNCPMCMDDLLLALTGIKEAIENQELTVNVDALVAAVTGVQTAIENQELTLDLSDLQQWLLGIQTAIENQELTLDLGDLQQWLLGIQTAIENQELTLDMGDLQQWLLGIQTAIENQELGVDVDFSQLEAVLVDIKNAIESLSEDEMQIINNVCCGCGCSCGSENNNPSPNPPVDIPPDDVYPPDPIIPPYDPPPHTQDYVQFLCNASHYLYYQFRLATLQLGDLMATGEASYGNVKDVLIGTLAVVNEVFAFLWAVYYQLVSWFVTNVTGTTAAAMVQEMDAHYDEFICALYSGDGAQGKRDNFVAVIDSLALPWAARYWLRLLEQNIDWVAWFYRDDFQEYEFPPSFQNRDCSSCGDAIPEIPQPEETSEYFLVTLDEGEFTLTPNNNSASLEYNQSTGIFTHTPLNGTLNYHEISVNVNEAAVCARVGASGLHAGVVYFADVVNFSGNTGLLNFPTTNAGLILAQQYLLVCRADNAEYANVQEFRDYIDQFENHSTYGNGPLDGTWRSQTYNTSTQGWGSMRYRVWFVAKKL